MLVYGDRSEPADPKELVGTLDARLEQVSQAPSGIDRHARLVGLLIEAGQLLQGVADAQFATFGEDRRGALTDGLGQCVLQLARCVCRSWDSGFRQVGRLPVVPGLDEAPSPVDLRTPEGFAFYAVYPEAYAEAARRLSLLRRPRVIGIRSIGTTLAAIVAAALNALPPVTVRPFGNPFARQIAISRDLEGELLAGEPHYVIVDEGPGQSGSSFGAVADWLEERGVPLGRIAFVPGHGGALGPKASGRHRERWARAQRIPAIFEELPRFLTCWVAPFVGRVDQPLFDISAGEWRKRRYADEGQWPAVNPAWERRKFLASAGGNRFLLKFAGLGAIGERKLGMARALHSAGFVPEPIGVVHGFLVERWQDDAQPLKRGVAPVGRIADYIGARVRLFPARSSHGASLTELLEMCRRNVSLALGDEFAGLVDEWKPRLGQLSGRIVRVKTDNRLLPHEWLRCRDRTLKTDALDHHAGHDLIGCQDMGWDVAGAIVEFELDPVQMAALIDRVQHSGGRHIDRELLAFYRLAYLAFRIGESSMSAAGCAGDEAARLQHRLSHYRRQLEQLLESSEAATRPASLVG